ncbi:MAG TPA: type II toxin-antitoxin system prevent-host-death family antitoxin [Trueperaceae bacterium]|nr:type II toxin-antitoxin system prevent-host-death family antitoxin [Trueperaceae bacterium]
MTRIGLRELRQNASAYIARVRAGEVIEVTVRGELVGRIVPASDSSWDRLVEEGHVRMPMGRVPLVQIEPLDAEAPLSEALEQLREEER